MIYQKMHMLYLKKKRIKKTVTDVFHQLLVLLQVLECMDLLTQKQTGHYLDLLILLYMV